VRVVIGDSIRLCVCVFEMVSNWIFLSHSPFYQRTSRQKQAPLLCEWKNIKSFSPVKRLSLPSPFPTLNLPLPHSFLISNKNLYLSYIQIALSSLSLHLYLTHPRHQSVVSAHFLLPHFVRFLCFSKWSHKTLLLFRLV